MRWFRAPGRVNLIGDHTDYNEGFVLPIAVDLDCLLGALGGQVSQTNRWRAERSLARRDPGRGRVRVRSLDVEGGTDVVDVAADGSDEPADVEPRWGRYVAGVVRALAERGRPPAGVEAALSSTVPPGSGLASSAALEVACALALADAAGFSLSPDELARGCQRAEHVATGVPCGIMDQLASVAGREGHALLVDCRTLAVEHVPLPAEVAVLVVHSGLPRTLAGSEYGERRAACEAAATALGVPALRDAAPADVADDPLARHVVAENARVLATARALANRDTAALGDLFAASHASLRDDYRVSTPELDALVDALVAAGAIGARLTGAGFGGCVVALVERERAGRIAEDALARYGVETRREARSFVCRAVSGARRVDADTCS